MSEEQAKPTSCPIRVAEANKRNIEQIMQGAGGKPTLVQFYANWCGHCAATRPEVDRASSMLCGDANVVRVNVEQHSKLAEKLGVDGLPTMILVENGQVLGKIEGESTAEELASFVRNRGAKVRAPRATRAPRMPRMPRVPVK
jgi:thioredoxin-like negative regulator of GroEL